MMRMLTLAALAVCAGSMAFGQTSNDQNQSMTGQKMMSPQNGYGDRWWMDTASYNNWDSQHRIAWLTHDLSGGDAYHLTRLMNDLPAGDSFVITKALDGIANHRYMMWTGNAMDTMTSSDTSMNRMNRRKGRQHRGKDMDKDKDMSTTTTTTSTTEAGTTTDTTMTTTTSTGMANHDYSGMRTSGAMWENSAMSVNDWQAYSILSSGLSDSERGNFGNLWPTLGWRDQGILLKLAKEYGDVSKANNGGWGY